MVRDTPHIFNPVTLHKRPMIFPSLCLGVRSYDFDLEAANTASTLLQHLLIAGALYIWTELGRTLCICVVLITI